MDDYKSLLHPNDEPDLSEVISRLLALETSDQKYALRGGSAVSYDSAGKIASISATYITGEVVNAQIASIDWAKITNVSVGTADIEAAAITQAKIANAAVDTTQIEDGAITNAKIENAAITTAKIANAQITNALINDLAAEKITAGVLAVGGTSQPTYIYLKRGGAVGSDVYLRWEGGSKMWSDDSNRIGINSVGSPMYIYVNSAQIMAILDNSQLVVGQDNSTYDVGMYIYGNLNQKRGNVRFQDAHLYVNTTSSPSENLWVGGSAGIEGNLKSNHHDPRSSNSYNLGGDSQYWDYVYSSEYVDKSMGWYDGGVTDLKTGEKISDMEAIRRLRPHPTQKNKNGSIKIDKKSFPRELYRPAWDRDNQKPYPRNKNDEPYIPAVKDEDGNIIEEERILTDGASLTHTVALCLGALKELDNEIKSLKSSLTKVSK